MELAVAVESESAVKSAVPGYIYSSTIFLYTQAVFSSCSRLRFLLVKKMEIGASTSDATG